MKKTTHTKVTKTTNTTKATTISKTTPVVKSTPIVTNPKPNNSDINEDEKKISDTKLELEKIKQRVPNFMSFVINFALFKNKSHNLLFKFLRYSKIVDFLPKIKNRKFSKVLLKSNYEYDNQDYKLNLVQIQKEFKTTPSYIEISNYNVITGYHMGVYICLGQSIHNLRHIDSIPLSSFKSFHEMHHHYAFYGKLFVFIGDGHHKIKKKAEQIASMKNLFEN